MTGRRLTKQKRREQLLDAAGEIVARGGVAALSMEGLAARAGVSKTLPYAHFDNADAVLVVLFRRELTRIAAAVGAGMAGETEPHARVRAAVAAYFDAVRARGPLLSVLTAPGSRVPAEADAGERVGVKYVADLFVRELGVPRRRAPALAAIFLGALAGAVDAWAHGDIRQATAQQLAVDIAVALCSSAASSALMPPSALPA